MPSNHLILCRPLLFLHESVLHIRWPEYWSFSFSISPSSEYSGLISFRMDWLDLVAAQGTLKSLFQYHSSKASILQCSAFFIVQLSHPYMTIQHLLCYKNADTLYISSSSPWVLSCVWLFATLWTVACQTLLSMEFPRQEYWNGLPFPSLGDLPDPGIKLRSSALQAESFTNWTTREVL